MQDQTAPSPGAFITYELERRGWSQRELAEIICRPFQLVNEIIKGKRAITTDTAVALGAAFGNSAEIWLQREAAYQISQANVDTHDVNRRARLFSLAPIKELERRGWIAKTENSDQLETELQRFFGVATLENDLSIGAATRKSDADEPLSPNQRTWCFRVRQIARSLVVAPYSPSNLPSCKAELRKIAAYPQESHKVAKVLADAGIRFVVVEPLSSTKVDGVAMWLDANKPVIGMSIRYDRCDSFWFTLFHELGHIEHEDEAPLDADITDTMAGIMTVRAEMERRANEYASNILIPKNEFESFVRRVGPLYSKEKIIKFSHRMKIHPAIVVGQLQRRQEIGYSSNREMLVKIRDFVVSTTVTDGWGHTLDLKGLG